MAISPDLYKEAAASTSLEPAKLKTLTILRDQKASSAVSSPRESDDEEPPLDLAGKLNWEIRRRYVKDKKIGEGQYAIVYRGHIRKDPKSFIAIKKIKVKENFDQGMHIDAIREVKFLSELQHPNIIHLLEVFTTKDQNVSIVLEYLPMGDLQMVIHAKKEIRYGAPDIKAWMGMINRAVWFCHENYVLHRDIKPNNIFIAANGELKLADFGLARSFADPMLKMTWEVVTSWYRPLELFYHAGHYSGAIDVWSVACVHVELLMGVPLLAAGGETNIGCISALVDIFGDSTEQNWPGVSSLPHWRAMNENRSSWQPVTSKTNLMRLWQTSDPDEGDLLYQMFQMDPRKRATTKQVLEHDYWKVAPKPTRTENLPKKGGGAKTFGEELKKRPGDMDIETGQVDKVARRLDFG